MVTRDEEKAEVLKKFLPHSSMATSLHTPLKQTDLTAGTRGAKSIPL